MILQKRVKGGILLYALLMLAVFSLLLQFYLHSQNALTQEHVASRDSNYAYLMAHLTMDNIDPKKQPSGHITFTGGESSYQQTEKQMEIIIKLKTGHTYQYHFPLSGEKE